MVEDMISDYDKDKISEFLYDTFRMTGATPSDIIDLMYEAWAEASRERMRNGRAEIEKAVHAIRS